MADKKPKPKKTYTLKIDKDLCKGCRLCIDFCPRGALEMSIELNRDGTPYVKVVRPETCNGCRRCTLVCPDACIELVEHIES